MTEPILSKSKKARIFKQLVSFLGEEFVNENAAVRSAYRGSNYSSLTPWGKGPEIVVMPREVEHVQEIVKLANMEKFTILPICCGTLTPFCEADVIVNMMSMDRILKIDTENSYVLLEPGVTFNRLDPLLKKEGHTIAHGSFPTTFSVVGNLALGRGINHNFSSRIAEQTLGQEIVMFDGTIMRTGTATFGKNYWSPFTMSTPDYRGLFTPTGLKTPMLGIITKAAIRTWPIMEAVGLPVGGFDSFDKGMRFCKAVTKAGFADESMLWSWTLVGQSETRAKGGKDDIDFLTHRMNADYTKPYKDLHYCYTWTQFRGYKEQVDVYRKLCERIAKEMGGKILTVKELQDTIPNVWESWRLGYGEFSPEKTKMFHTWKVGGQGLVETWWYAGWLEDVIKLEEAYNRRLKEKYNRLTPYYCRVFESGIGAHLRYQPPADIADEFHAKKYLKIRDEMHAWVLDNFPNIHAPAGYQRVKTHSIGMSTVVDKIREALDPNHIGYMPGEKRLESEEEGKAAAS